MATAVSEIVRNAFTHARGGRAEFFMSEPDALAALLVRVSDEGTGIADIEGVLAGHVRNSTGAAGSGLIAAKRLLDIFELDSLPGRGTVVTLGQRLPASAGRPTPDKLAEIAALLKPETPADPLRLLREQNLELIQSLDEVRHQREESEKLSRELGDTNRGVVALYAELDERAEQLRRASELKSRFLSHMGHEFRTPLNSIMALSRMLLDRLDGDLNTEQERQVGYIRQSAESLLDLVNDLLDLSKVEAGKAEIKARPFTVAELFGALRGALKPLHNNPAVELVFEWDDQLPELFTDEAKVAQILRNLISNALKNTEEGEVRVSARLDPDDGLIIISVHDTGIGIAPQDQERIFEEFEQIETRLQQNVKGTGLGLPLSRSLAALLGGTIELESVVGQGSVFRLSIPVTVSKAPPAVRPAGTALGRKRVLLIDDDEPSRYVMRQLLRGEQVAYQPFEAASGLEGIRLAQEVAPAAIILDLQMPDLDGFAVIERLQANPITRAIPVIIATSLTLTALLRAKLPAGIRVLSKDGMTPQTIVSALNEATGRDGHL